jgi:AraC-like DNA-binding protein
MKAIIISCIALGVFLLSFLLTKKQKLQADYFLILYLALFIASEAYFYLETFSFFEYSIWMLLGKGLFLICGPVFFYYVYTLITAKKPSIFLYFFTLLPFVAYVGNFFVYYLAGFPIHLMEIKNGLLYINGQLPLTWTLFSILFLLSDFFYLIWFKILLINYKTRALNSVSNPDLINLDWLNGIFYFWMVSLAVLLPLTALSISGNLLDIESVNILLQLDYLILIFLLGYFGFKQTTVFNDFSRSTNVDTKRQPYKRSALTPMQAETYHQNLIQLMAEEKPYLKGELTAQELASMLGISTNYLSQILNQNQQQNFFDFINSYRVQEVKSRVASTHFQNYTLLAIALESGFNSKTSFNTVFKKNTGMTPSQFHKTISKEEILRK